MALKLTTLSISTNYYYAPTCEELQWTLQTVTSQSKNTSPSAHAKSKAGDQTHPTVCVLAWLYICKEPLHPKHVDFTVYLQMNEPCSESNAFKRVRHIACDAELFSVTICL